MVREIVSPTFMNQRRLEPGDPVLPHRVPRPAPAGAQTSTPEEVIFDKAEAAASRDELIAERERLGARRREVADALEQASDAEARFLSYERSWIDTRLAQIESLIESE